MKQRTVAVTGANSGIGLEITSLLLQDSWRVVGLDLGTERLQALQAAYPDTLTFNLCDVGNANSIEQAFSDIACSTEKLDALVCSAGILRTAPLIGMNPVDFDQLFAVNTRGPLLCAQAAYQLLKQGATESSPSRIVMLSSASSIRPKVGGGAYAASKAALSHLTRVMAVELGPEHIRVNAVAPASVDTPMIQHVMEKADTAGYKASGKSPLGRISKTTEIASVVQFLLSSASDYVNGAIIPVDGGTTAAYTPA